MLTRIFQEMNLLQKELNSLDGVEQKKATADHQTDVYAQIVTDPVLRRKTEKLFRDGHHARAVEEAYKYLDNLVKKTANLSDQKLTGSSLMQKVFSPDHPILKLNAGVSTSETDEQKGYLQIFSGSMTGIRNPRAHESDWEDSEGHAIELLALANHLIEKVKNAEKCDD